ncbi:hypothetical protein [Ruegeria arenilitoris]|uniref:hypothetical protein n=1 Tax=Ruegeria arenilitoris TaxID=1173585 RepID=UPI00147F58FA|nr:hypothetical protein [Ruegeria arenilitoris]
MSGSIELQLLEFIDEWNSSPDSPPGGACILAPDILSELQWPDEFDRSDPARFGRKVQIEMQALKEKGYITSELLLSGAWTSVRLTSAGHKYLQSLRSTLEVNQKPQKNESFSFLGILGAFCSKYLLPVAVGVTIALVLFSLGIGK